MKAALARTELRTIFDVAHRYVAGASSVQELNGAIGRAIAWAKSSGTAPQVLELLDEWNRMVNRRWNECGLEKIPLSEAEFHAWLHEQLIGPAS